ncbi:MAG: hypothetical protein H6737_02035 [Alphaproteobacteria bacterium]|nr:hypothetical protein [Alphaproteobacteria bacterium]
MQVIRADSGVIVTLPLAPSDPWPGPVPVALAIPLVLAGSIAVAAVGWAGDLGPWLVGGAPMLSLFVPLAWLVRRSRSRHATLILDALMLRVVAGERAPAFHGDALKAAVAWNHLWVEEGSERIELALEPLDGDEVTTLREILRDLTVRSRDVSAPARA